MLKEMKIPPESRGHLVLLTVFWGIASVGSGCAIWNLADGLDYIFSSIWLALMGLMVGSSVRREGMRGWCVNRMGEVARRQVAWAQLKNGKCEMVCFGYHFAGMRILQRRVILTEIEVVEWNPGQATSLAGRDMKDWHIVLWYGYIDESERKGERWRRPGKELCIVGPSRAKEVTEAFGMQFLGFLREMGVSLQPGGKENQYVRSTNERDDEGEERGGGHKY